VTRQPVDLGDRLIEARFRAHELAGIVAGMPGIGPLLGAEFLAAVCNDLTDFSSPDGPAAFAGQAPAPHDSGKRNGELHRPRHCHRGLQRIFYMSALMSVRYDPNSRAFHDRERAEGKRHTQAVIAFARRRVNVLWALIRDGRLCEIAPRHTGWALRRKRGDEPCPLSADCGHVHRRERNDRVQTLGPDLGRGRRGRDMARRH
jgi:hypothetical protein